MDWLNGISGESLREMMLLTRSTVTWVLSGGNSSSCLSQPSSNASRATVSKRPSGLMPAPRPLRGSACLPLTVFKGTTLLRHQQLAHRCQLPALVLVHLRIVEVERSERLDDGGADYDARKPLVVRRHHVPRRVLGRRLPDHLLIRRHVVLPVAALARIGRREFPVLVRIVEPLQETAFLLAAPDVQEELADQDAVAGEVALEVADVLEALAPDALAYQLLRQLLPCQQRLVDSHHQNLLVVGAVEDANAPALGQMLHAAPQVIVVEVLRRGRLERCHLHALRVDARHDVLDGAVFPRRIHCLEDEQHRPAVLGVEHVLERRELLDPEPEGLLRPRLVLPAEIAGVAGVVVLQPEALARGDAVFVIELVGELDDSLQAE